MNSLQNEFDQLTPEAQDVLIKLFNGQSAYPTHAAKKQLIDGEWCVPHPYMAFAYGYGDKTKELFDGWKESQP